MENKALILKALDLTKDRSSKFIEKSYKEQYGNNWENNLINGPYQEIEMNGISKKGNDLKYRDLNFYISSFLTHWNVFLKSKFCSNFPLTLCHTVKHYRNKWAHQSSFNTKETYRIIDSCICLIDELGENSDDINELAKEGLQNFFNDIIKGLYNDMGNGSKKQTNSITTINTINNNDISPIQNNSINYNQNSIPTIENNNINNINYPNNNVNFNNLQHNHINSSNNNLNNFDEHLNYYNNYIKGNENLYNNGNNNVNNNGNFNSNVNNNVNSGNNYINNGLMNYNLNYNNNNQFNNQTNSVSQTNTNNLNYNSNNMTNTNNKQTSNKEIHIEKGFILTSYDET